LGYSADFARELSATDSDMEAAGFYHVLDDKLDRDVLREGISGDF
jgi:hypothetical protein